MANYLEVFKREPKIHPTAIRDTLRLRKTEGYFWPSGTQVYVGPQGSGKTISAVRHLLRLRSRYPRAIVVSNLVLNGQKPLAFSNEEELAMVLRVLKRDKNASKGYIRFNTAEELALALVGVNNDIYGVIYVVDEIHTYFNALDSKNIPLYVFTEISQQRKQRKVIIGTSQLFLRMAKPLREQCDNIVVCDTKYGQLTFQTAYDGMTVEQDFDGKLSGTVKKKGFFFQDRETREAFDTFQKVVSGAEQYEKVEKKEKK